MFKLLNQKGHLTWYLAELMLYFLLMDRLHRDILKPLFASGPWNGALWFALAAGLWLIRSMFLDWCVLRGHKGPWNRINGPTEDAELELYTRRLLCENQEIAWDRDFAAQYLVVLMALTAAVGPYKNGTKIPRSGWLRGIFACII